MRRIKLPMTREVKNGLRAGQMLLLSGTIYTARDAAHKRLTEMLKKKKKLPIPLKDEILYYTGPTPVPPGRRIGSCGPTTSSRMDPFTLPLLKKGLAGAIGKGERSESIRHAFKKFNAVYFVTIGGAGAFLSRRIKSIKPVAFKDIGPEAVYRLEIEDFPVIVAIDSSGRNIHERRRKGKRVVKED